MQQMAIIKIISKTKIIIMEAIAMADIIKAIMAAMAMADIIMADITPALHIIIPAAPVVMYAHHCYAPIAAANVWAEI